MLDQGILDFGPIEPLADDVARSHPAQRESGSMLDSEFLICDRRASARQVQLAQFLALVLLLGCIAIFPYRAQQLPSITAFVSVIDAIHFLFGGITAAILLSLASILRSRALVVLGAGFFLAGLLAIGHGLTYPNVFSRAGLLGAQSD